jgi:fumarate reductase iron-sulfur subunit
MEETKTIKVKIFRFDPSKDKTPSYITYNVPIVEGMSVLNVLNYIYENLDSSLSYYYSCRRGSTTCCAVMLNGEAAQPCTTIAKGDVTVEPPVSLGFKVIKDLIAEDISINTRDLLFLAREKALSKFQNATGA